MDVIYILVCSTSIQIGFYIQEKSICFHLLFGPNMIHWGPACHILLMTLDVIPHRQGVWVAYEEVSLKDAFIL